jgi:hypothetical protein
VSADTRTDAGARLREDVAHVREHAERECPCPVGGACTDPRPPTLAEVLDRLMLLRPALYGGWTERRLAAELAAAGAPVGWP